MVFFLEEVDGYAERAFFYCPEKEVSHSVDIMGVFGNYTEEPTPEEFEAFCERCDKSFGEAFGEGVDWRF